jgi:hypothetical protein
MYERGDVVSYWGTRYLMYSCSALARSRSATVDSGRLPNQNAQPLAGEGEVGDMRVDVQAIPDVDAADLVCR